MSLSLPLSHLVHVRHVVIATFALGLAAVHADEPTLSKYLRSGEFSAAKQMVEHQPPATRDDVLAQIASSQFVSGDSTAAATTLRDIESPSARQSAGGDGRGGNSFADFQSLIDLIQTTVVPDTWEALGGPSTMSEYPQGIYVDSEGTVREHVEPISGTEAENLRAMLRAQAPQFSAAASRGSDWRSPSNLRFVSLKRLRDEITRRRLQGVGDDAGTRYLAGLTDVRYVMLTGDDVVLAGQVGGIEPFQGWHRDVTTKLHALRSDFLFTCLSSALTGRPFGCTIDPTTEGLQRTAVLAQEVKQDRVPIGQAADQMKKALGMQRVEVFGTAADSPIAYLMVQADRHMKQLALGEHPMPAPAKNYLDMVDAMIDRGTPDDLLLRLWFTASECEVRSDGNHRVFELSGTPIRLSGQNERAVASGQRGHRTTDIRTDAFVRDFNKHWASIRQAYPIYASLESVYRCAAITEILRRHAPEELKSGLLSSLAMESSANVHSMPAPRQVESIATMHTVRYGRKRHHILLASGGVEVNPRRTVSAAAKVYPSLDSVADPSEHAPKQVGRWWFDQ